MFLPLGTASIITAASGWGWTLDKPKKKWSRRDGDTRTPFERGLAEVYFEPNTGCWLWSGVVHEHGYGLVKYNGRVRRANRASYHYHYGDFDASLMVLHNCDMPGCVNPAHLRLGTAADNTADIIKRGRPIGRPKRLIQSASV